MKLCLAAILGIPYWSNIQHMWLLQHAESLECNDNITSGGKVMGCMDSKRTSMVHMFAFYSFWRRHNRVL